MKEKRARWRFDVQGVVQGVGFRPFVHEMARALNLDGYVRNTTGGVEIALQGRRRDMEAFLHALKHGAPPLARVLDVGVSDLPVDPDQARGCDIQDSLCQSGRTLISPDVATCPACLAEVMDPDDRRHGYAFSNCTHCGPRFTIIDALPYDRARTTMRGFALCDDCAKEYGDPSDRRFHAQPIACPACGPALWYVENGVEDRDDPIGAAANRLNRGGIVGIRGLGGFHLCCCADDAEAVARMRTSKFRPSKPLAVMVRRVDDLHPFCEVRPMEARLLMSPEAPIVLLRKRGVELAPDIAPGNAYLGAMLPYTPLHHVLLARVDRPMVMTSGNPGGEPLCKDNEEAQALLDRFVDGFLLHDRPILRRCDDSVVMAVGETLQPVRRSRGFAPVPVLLSEALSLPAPVLAVGADMKNVSAVAADRQVFLTAHIGDLSHPRVREEQARATRDLARLFGIAPAAVVCDLHPGYASTRFAEEESARLNVPLVRVQHHHAHIAGCLAEHGGEGRVIGLSFDGTGYGADGHIWGGEVMVADVAGFERYFHLEYLPLPGGDAAVRKPYRTGLAYAQALGVDVTGIFPDVPALERTLLSQMIQGKVNAPLTSSAGRLFDAVSACLGLCLDATHEAQAAMALEAAALTCCEDVAPYDFAFDGQTIRLGALVQGVLGDRYKGISTVAIARRFHRTLAEMAILASVRVREATGLNRVALSGGVWQNRLLLGMAMAGLSEAGFEVLLHHAVPANDGGLALGQVVVGGGALAR